MRSGHMWWRNGEGSGWAATGAAGTVVTKAPAPGRRATRSPRTPAAPSGWLLPGAGCRQGHQYTPSAVRRSIARFLRVMHSGSGPPASNAGSRRARSSAFADLDGMGGNGAADLIAAPIAGEHRHARVDIGRWTKDVDVVMAGEPKLLDPDVRDGLILKLAALVILDLPVARPSPGSRTPLPSA